jgi:hypothetical protein
MMSLRRGGAAQHGKGLPSPARRTRYLKVKEIEI